MAHFIQNRRENIFCLAQAKPKIFSLGFGEIERFELEFIGQLVY